MSMQVCANCGESFQLTEDRCAHCGWQPGSAKMREAMKRGDVQTLARGVLLDELLSGAEQSAEAK